MVYYVYDLKWMEEKWENMFYPFFRQIGNKYPKVLVVRLRGGKNWRWKVYFAVPNLTIIFTY